MRTLAVGLFVSQSNYSFQLGPLRAAGQHSFKFLSDTTLKSVFEDDSSVDGEPDGASFRESLKPSGTGWDRRHELLWSVGSERRLSVDESAFETSVGQPDAPALCNHQEVGGISRMEKTAQWPSL